MTSSIQQPPATRAGELEVCRRELEAARRTYAGSVRTTWKSYGAREIEYVERELLREALDVLGHQHGYDKTLADERCTVLTELAGTDLRDHVQIVTRPPEGQTTAHVFLENWRFGLSRVLGRERNDRSLLPMVTRLVHREAAIRAMARGLELTPELVHVLLAHEVELERAFTRRVNALAGRTIARLIGVTASASARERQDLYASEAYPLLSEEPPLAMRRRSKFTATPLMENLLSTL